MKDRIMLKWLAGFVMTVSLGNWAAAQAAPDAGDDSAIAPFVDENTFAVVRVQADKVDAGAIKDWILASVDASRIDPKEAARFKQQAGEPFDEMGRWIDRFKKAGGKRLYVIASLSDIPRHGPFVVVPIEKGTNADAIVDLMTPEHLKKNGQPPANGSPSEHAEKLGDLVVFAEGATLQRLKDTPPAQPRPELAKAMAAAGDAPVRVALIPSDAQRQMFEAIAPELPKELGGGPAKTLSHGVQWGAIWAQLPPQTSVHLIIEAQDAANAKALQDVANKGLIWLRGNAKNLPLDVDALAGLAAPQVEGNRLVVTLDAANKSKELASAVLIPSLMRARQTAERVRSASNLRQLLLGAIMYANENKNAWPDKLEQIKPYMGDEKLFKAVMINPIRPEQTPGYTYRKPAGQGSARTIVMHETYTQWPAGGINVGFADGHVEWLRDEAFFKRSLEDK